jgi:hypothetical protein
MTDQSIEAALITAAAKQALSPAAKLLKSLGVANFQSLASKFTRSFQGHIDFVNERCSKIKNILYRDDTVLFASQYVNVFFTNGKGNRIADNGALKRIISGDKTLISGTAGAGKTMFMRWTALRLIAGIEHHGRIPLFLEMRYLEEEAVKEPLERLLYDRTSSSADASGYATFLEGLKAGVFIVLFDALDEVNPHFRAKLISRITDFIRQYPLVGFAASSRQDEKTESLQELSVLRTMPMTQKQVVQVIKNLEWDEEVKNKLIHRLEGGLYDQLEEFLSNPLLATIMLLAFDYSGDIPTKLTAFYQQAFDALYQRHDAAKGAYKRDHYAGLPIDRFENVFATFSFQTYLNYKFEFSDSELLSSFNEACEYNQETVDPGLIVEDCKESVCLFQREGLDNVFAHRSFQEYFCALFIARYRESDVGRLIDAVASLETRSNVLKMLYQLAPEVVEYEWILPLLKKYLSEYGRIQINTKSGFAKAFSGCFQQLAIYPANGEVKYISWGSPSRNVSAHAGRWISVVSTATENKLPFFHGLGSVRIWDNMESFANSLPIEKQDKFRKRIAKFPIDQNDSEVTQEFIISANDADWLIHSELPSVFENMRISIRKYHDEIVERRAARGATVKGLLTKPRSKRFV